MARWFRWDAVDVGVGGLAAVVPFVVVDRVGPRHEPRELHLLAALLGDLRHRREDVRVHRRALRPTHLRAEEQQELVDLLVGHVAAVQRRVRVGLHRDRRVGRADARQRDPTPVARSEHAAAPHLAEHEPDHAGVDVRAHRRWRRRGHDVLVLRLRVALAVVAVGPLAHGCSSLHRTCRVSTGIKPDLVPRRKRASSDQAVNGSIDVSGSRRRWSLPSRAGERRTGRRCRRRRPGTPARPGASRVRRRRARSPRG